MIATNREDLTDEEIGNMLEVVDNIIISNFKKEINNMIAEQISTYYNNDLLFDTDNFDYEIKDALCTINGIINKKINSNEIKDILRKKYKLDIINDYPIKINELK